MRDRDDLKVRMGSFFTDTRMHRCFAMKCRFNASGQCNLKEISMDHEARCQWYEEKTAVPDDEGLSLEVDRG